MTGRWVRLPAVLWRRTLDGMLVRTPAGETIALSASATALLGLLDTPTSAAEAARELAAATGASPETVRRDVDAALAGLARRGVVEACR